MKKDSPAPDLRFPIGPGLLAVMTEEQAQLMLLDTGEGVSPFSCPRFFVLQAANPRNRWFPENVFCLGGEKPPRPPPPGTLGCQPPPGKLARQLPPFHLNVRQSTAGPGATAACTKQWDKCYSKQGLDSR